jgi:membrane associated rhomboid family serine protease
VWGKVFKDCFTENNGESYDLARILAAFCAVTGIPFFLFMSAYSVIHDPNHHFEMQSFAAAFGMIVGSIAGLILSVAVKQKTDLPLPPNGGSQ